MKAIACQVANGELAAGIDRISRISAHFGCHHQGTLDLRASPSAAERGAGARPLRRAILARTSPPRAHDDARPSSNSVASNERGGEKRINGPPPPFGAATEVTPKFISPADPAARWTGALSGQAFFAYSTNYLIVLTTRSSLMWKRPPRSARLRFWPEHRARTAVTRASAFPTFTRRCSGLADGRA
jgi:hypothetical protein